MKHCYCFKTKMQKPVVTQVHSEADMETVRILIFVNLTIGNSMVMKLQRMQEKRAHSKKKKKRSLVKTRFSSLRLTYLRELD